jgi:hypothetical protein
MSWLLRSTKSNLLSSTSSLSRTFSSIPRSTNQIGAISPAYAELFHRTTATLPTGTPSPILTISSIILLSLFRSVFESLDFFELACYFSADENPTKGNVIGFPKNLENKFGGDSNVINSLVCVFFVFIFCVCLFCCILHSAK